MAFLKDQNPELYHYFAGTTGSDDMFTNSRGHVFGGAGNDTIFGGIVPPEVMRAGTYLLYYGGVSRGAEFGHPDKVTAGQPGNIGGSNPLHGDGRDQGHIGEGHTLVLGSQADRAFIHGPARDSALIARIWTDLFEGDTFVFDNSDERRGDSGWDFYDFRGSRDGDIFTVTGFKARSYSDNAIVDQQNVFFLTTDDHRGKFHPFKVKVDGREVGDDIHAELMEHTDRNDGRPIDGEGADGAQWFL